jgi:choline kinase
MLKKAIILAAGEGTRLRPFTIDRPKCLVSIAGKTLIDRQLAVLATENITSIILVGGYCSDMLKLPNTTLIVNPIYAVTNMVWSLFCAEPELNEPVLVSYGDIVYSRKVLRALLKSQGDIAVTIDIDWEQYWRARGENPLDDAETLRLAVDGRILEIGKKPSTLDQIEGQYMGLMKFSRIGCEQLINAFHEAQRSGGLAGKSVEKAYMTDMLQALIDKGIRVDSVTIQGEWIEVDTVSDMNLSITKQRLLDIEKFSC